MFPCGLNKCPKFFLVNSFPWAPLCLGYVSSRGGIHEASKQVANFSLPSCFHFIQPKIMLSQEAETHTAHMLRGIGI